MRDDVSREMHYGDDLAHAHERTVFNPPSERITFTCANFFPGTESETT